MENLREIIRDLQDRLGVLEGRAGILPLELDALHERTVALEAEAGLTPRAGDVTLASVASRLGRLEYKAGLPEGGAARSLRDLDKRLTALEGPADPGDPALNQRREDESQDAYEARLEQQRLAGSGTYRGASSRRYAPGRRTPVPVDPELLDESERMARGIPRPPRQP
jgi:hypothetical protein